MNPKMMDDKPETANADAIDRDQEARDVLDLGPPRTDGKPEVEGPSAAELRAKKKITRDRKALEKRGQELLGAERAKKSAPKKPKSVTGKMVKEHTKVMGKLAKAADKAKRDRKSLAKALKKTDTAKDLKKISKAARKVLKAQGLKPLKKRDIVKVTKAEAAKAVKAAMAHGKKISHVIAEAIDLRKVPTVRPAPHTGQSRPSFDLAYDDLSKDQKLIVAKLNGNPKESRQPFAVKELAIGSDEQTDSGATRSLLRVRNSMRRLVPGGWAESKDRGVFMITAKGRKLLGERK